MKILQLTPRLPYPTDDGGKVDMLDFARLLSPQHDITLVSFVNRKVDDSHVSYLKQYYSRVETVLLTTGTIGSKLWNILFSPVPYAIQKYYSLEMFGKLDEMNKNHHFDIVRIDHMHLACYDKIFQNQPVLLRKQNVDATIMKRLFETDRRPHVKLYAYLQWKKLLLYERQTCRRFPNCVMITAEDARVLKSMDSPIHTSVIPCSMKVKPDGLQERKSDSNLITFIGSMDWFPNHDAVVYFLEEIWPLIKIKIPLVKFQIIGRNPSKKIFELATKSDASVKGFVENISSFLDDTGVFVVPLRIGSGMRIKILEAMSMGIPVVSTSIGMEGIDAIPGKDLLVADDPPSFANSVIQILQDPELMNRLSLNGRELIQNKYSNEAIRKQWEDLLIQEIKSYQSSI